MLFFRALSYCSYKVVDTSFSLTLYRIPTTILATIIIPVLCFNFLVCLVYLLPTSSGERVGLGITLVLAFSVLLMNISNMVPDSSKGQVDIGQCCVTHLNKAGYMAGQSRTVGQGQ